MKKCVFLFLLSFTLLSSSIWGLNEQEDSTAASPCSFEISFWKPLIFGGYTEVREWQYIGQKYNLNEDLGLNSLESFEFTFSFPLSRNHHINVLLGRYFFQGHQLLTENGYYNGTELTENTVASVDASRYIRILLLDYFTLSETEKEKLQLVFGISLDAIRFLVDAPYTPTTPRKETFEQFDKQIVPVPMIGIKWNKHLSDNTLLRAEGRAGTWPGLDTWYDEEGTIKIWQYNLETYIGVSKYFGNVVSELNFNFRMIYLKGESNEDTNEIFIHGFGPELRIVYEF
ncbi:MAG: hypothetical protein PVH88_24865 [Ignavibacteria bacterium]|jgi:hypothetical protein